MSGPRPRLLLDEHVWPGLIEVFAPQGYDLQHVVRVGLQSVSDEAVLAFATREERVVLTNNYRDLRDWSLSGMRPGEVTPGWS